MKFFVASFVREHVVPVKIHQVLITHQNERIRESRGVLRCTGSVLLCMLSVENLSRLSNLYLLSILLCHLQSIVRLATSLTLASNSKLLETSRNREEIGPTRQQLSSGEHPTSTSPTPTLSLVQSVSCQRSRPARCTVNQHNQYID